MILSCKTKGTGAYSVMVDDDKADILSQYTWRANQAMKAGIPILRIVGTHKVSKIKVMLPRLLTGISDLKQVVRQKEDGLNYTLRNLEIVSRSQHQAFKAKSKNGNSKYFGVHLSKNGSYIASITKNGTTTYLGCSKNEEEAAEIYDLAAKKLHGKSARLNFS